MRSFNKVSALLCSWALYASGVAWADDTDIYLNSSASGAAPYLMFMLDYRQDLSGPFCKASGNVSGRCKTVLNFPDAFPLLQSLDAMINGVPGDTDGDGVGDSAILAAGDGDSNFDGLRDSAAVMDDFEASKIQSLVAVIRAVFEKFAGINVGMMIPNNDNGGTLLRGYKEFQASDANGAKAELVNILLNLPMPGTGNAFHESQPKEMHYEWFRYINGERVLYGEATANNFQGTNSPAPDASVFTGGVGNRTYISPFTASPSDFECSKFYQVYATSGNEGGSDSDLTTQITTDFNSASASSFEDMMSYMTNNDLLLATPGEQTLKSWFIQIGNSAAFADDWAEAAGTDDQYMSVADGADLVNVQTILESAFIEALSVSTTFVAASVPVNVFNRVQTLDNFYIALFEARSTPRWPGNIKKLKLADTDADGIFDDIIDARNVTAFSDDDGRIKYEALTFWTDSLTLPPADPENNEVSGRDGRAVERGGAGQNIPGFLAGSVGDLNSSVTRKLFYEPSAAGAFVPFNATAATATALQSDLGAATSAEALSLIRWARGQDVDDEDTDGNRVEPRNWILGDAIHSRPLAINYGATTGYSQTNPNIRLFMGTNDGVFHIFQNTTPAGNDSGAETFGFIPRELMKNYPSLRANALTRHLYGVDGEPVALVDDIDSDGTIESGETVYIYVGLRRGGKSYYMLNASDPSGAPEYMGRITKGGDFSELGMTFSKPKVTKVRYGGTTVDALIFAGGYDTNKDSTSTDVDGSEGADTEGNAIYVVNARTLQLIWKTTLGAGAATNSVYSSPAMQFSIPSDIASLDADRNGITDRLYVADTGGQLWRVDLPEGNLTADINHRRDRWQANVLARVSSGTAAGDRRFFHRPDVVQTRDIMGDYEGIMLASGDRANPLETADENLLIYIKDRNVVSGNPPATTLTVADLADVNACITCTAVDYRNGWYRELSDAGEKGLSSPLAANGMVFFTSYVPNDGSDSCAPSEGSGKLYILGVGDGEEVFNGSAGMDVGPGIPASPIALSGDMLLLPGTGIGEINEAGLVGRGKLLGLSGRSVWPLYWRSTGKDAL